MRSFFLKDMAGKSFAEEEGVGYLTAAVEADADGGQADGARAGVDEHALARLQAAPHDEGIVGGHVGHRHGGCVPQRPGLGDLPHLRQAVVMITSPQASGISHACGRRSHAHIISGLRDLPRLWQAQH